MDALEWTIPLKWMFWGLGAPLFQETAISYIPITTMNAPQVINSIINGIYVCD